MLYSNCSDVLGQLHALLSMQRCALSQNGCLKEQSRGNIEGCGQGL